MFSGTVAGQRLECVDHTGPGPPVALLEHGRVPVVAVGVTAFVALQLRTDYGNGGYGSLGLYWYLAYRVGSVSGNAGVLLRKGSTLGRHCRWHC